MHHFLVTLVALLFSVFHHSHFTQRVSETATLDMRPPSSSLVILPDRHAFEHTYAEGGYAEGACVSCRRMSLSYNMR